LRWAILSAGVVISVSLRPLVRMHWLDHEVVGWPGWSVGWAGVQRADGT
jgi:hypothetical protein